MNSTTSIRATFKGPVPSVKYEPGKEYFLVLYQRTTDKGVIITLLNGTGTVPYDSLNAFLNNWKNISRL